MNEKLSPKEIKRYCDQQYKKMGRVLPPEYCLACQGCALGFLIKMIGEQRP